MLRGERADVTDFFLMTLVDTSAVKHNMLKYIIYKIKRSHTKHTTKYTTTKGEPKEELRIYVNSALFSTVNCVSALFASLRNKIKISTGLFEMIVGVLTTCHTQYT